MIPTPNCLVANGELAHLIDGKMPSLSFVQATLYYLNDTTTHYVAWACTTSAVHLPTLPNLETFQQGLQVHQDVSLLAPYRVAYSFPLTDDATWLWVGFDLNSNRYDHLMGEDEKAFEMLRIPFLELIERGIRDEALQRALQTTRQLMASENSAEAFGKVYHTFFSPQQHDAILLSKWDLNNEAALYPQYLMVGDSYFVAQGQHRMRGQRVQITNNWDGTPTECDDLIAQLFDATPPPHIEWRGFPIKHHGNIMAILLVSWHHTRLQDRIEQTIFLQEIQPSFQVWCDQFYRHIVSKWVTTQDVVDSIQEGLLLIRVEEGNAKVALENGAFRHLFGLPTHQGVVGLWLYEVLIRIPLEPDIRSELRKIWNETILEPEELHTLRFTITDLNGTERIIHWFCTPIQTSLSVVQSVLVFSFRDVTAEQVNREARLSFFSRISHELRTPLTSIRGFTEMLLQHTDEVFSEDTQEYLKIISQSSQHLENVLSDILEIIRLDAGDTTFKLQPVAFTSILKEAIQQSRELYNQDERTILFKDQTRSLHVMVDRKRLVRALTNLMGNAMVYSPSDRPIHLTVKRCDTVLEIPLHAPSGIILPCLLLEIRDEGDGLSVQDVERVFEPFYRSKWVIQKRIPGVGLGLAVVRSFIEKQNGKSWATANQPDSPGGKFYITLPLIEKPKKKP